MIVSWNWLKQYVDLKMPLEVLTERLTISGLNLEGINHVDGDLGIDLEVTSNRPDCLGHIGVAREVRVLFDGKLTIPTPEPNTVAEKTDSVTSVDIECEDLCPQYVARVIRGVKIGPSPDWMQRRLNTLGIAAIHNVVDITNYVMLECGQPLHAFDFDKLHGRRIVVRRARKGEKLEAINQREYELDHEMCVIADADHPVALGGVMGGVETEIGEATVNLLIETADFAPVSIRSTARKLNLHSDSSFRFERGVDARRLRWASDRCCQLILELAGGELLDQPVVAGTNPEEKRPSITLRFHQLSRILGIDVPSDEAIRILTSLGLEQQGQPNGGRVDFIPPSWRRDLTREVDLIEEVARIHGYEKIPEDVPVPLQLSARTHHDRVTNVVRELLTATGFFEAVTLSFVSEDVCSLFTPRGNQPLLRVEHSSRRHENVLRQSLIPSLLKSRRENERHGTFNAQLFEIAKVYLASPRAGTVPAAAPFDAEIASAEQQTRPTATPASPRAGTVPAAAPFDAETTSAGQRTSPTATPAGRPERDAEPTMIGLVSSRSFSEMKGLVEMLARRVNRASAVTVIPAVVPQFVTGRGTEVLLNGKHWGWLGELDRTVSDQLDLRDAVNVAELDLTTLEDSANLTPTYSPLPQFPAVDRDLNFLLDEAISWQELEEIVRSAAGPLLEKLSFAGQYVGKQIDAGKKSYVLTLSYRSPERTLTAEEVERAQAAVIEACRSKLKATLR
jgi:phenylalanyl-tRNA synthetase beta chain